MDLKDYEKHLKHYLARQSDVIKPAKCEALQKEITLVHDTRKTNDQTAAKDILEQIEKKEKKLFPKPPMYKIRETVEMLVVVIGIAGGVRALFIQPFQIPTGSMQPTLHGVNFYWKEELPATNKLKAILNYLHYSWRQLDVDVKKEGYLETKRINDVSKPFWPKTEITIAGERYRLPGRPSELMDKDYALKNAEFDRKGVRFEKGDKLAKGYLESGDHLFVDRTRYAFFEPKRGDVAVFTTKGIKADDGEPFSGNFYIKRLVGLPGDELKIVDRKLYVKLPGETEFKLVDGSIHPGFERMYSMKGGYRGYSHFPPQREIINGRFRSSKGSEYLRNNQETFTVPEGHYFMMGDNSEHSRDSRFFGPVPRKNLLGRACFVWWPFTRRWGLVDRQEPLPYESQLNSSLD